ncbi:DMT family transporter [Aquicoccus sp. G2-2]|jgi:drug/metabolite transporter (DMT)-like permease|uniref:DMT family transporter n=1 Tax=Aquicoccus sp. G2-2 TaxID=3092120 RepID=UPI002AE07D64|nr:DMT family transporter [Aquicoccus sp. G2-2]MEA1112236.1 DMT family transporter [Aquicoccus sp. G2-2]
MSNATFSPKPASGAETSLIWRAAPTIFVLFWAGGYSFAKLGLAHIEPITMLVIRFALAALILGVLLSFMKVAWPKRAGHWAALALSGLLMQSAYFGFGYMAMKSGVNAGTMPILMALQPLLVAGASFWLAPGTGTGLRLWLGLLLGFAGVVLVVVSGDSLGPSPMTGLLFATGALIAITVVTLFEKWHSYDTHPLVGSLVQYVVGFFSLLPVAMIWETGKIDWAPELVVSLIYLVIGNSLISITLFVGLVHRGNATRISALMYLVPPLALFLAWLILGEVLAPLAFGGFLLSVAGVYLVNRATA